MRKGAEIVDLRFSEIAYLGAASIVARSADLISQVDKLLQDEGISMWPYTTRTQDKYHTITLYKEK